jgi:lipopolysaccharide transport system permease protein
MSPSSFQLPNLLYHTVRARLANELRLYYLHFVWWFAEPLLDMAIYYVVFAILLKQGTENYVPFLLIGIVFWAWFNRSLQNGSLSILHAKDLMAQMNLPKAFFPIATVCQDFVKQVFVMAVLLVFLVLYGMPVSLSWLCLPVLMAIQFVFIIGLAVFLSAIVPFFPDLKFIITAGLQLMFFVSGVFFDIDSTVLPVHRGIVYLNPMAGLIRNYRQILMQGVWPDWPYLLGAFLSAALVLLLSMLLVRHFGHIYPKIVI